MLRQVDRRGFVGGRLILDDQFVRIGERVRDGRGQIAGISFFTVRALVAESNANSVCGTNLLRFPDFLVEAVDATMNVIRTVVGGERIVLSIESELSSGNAVGIASDDRAEVR